MALYLIGLNLDSPTAHYRVERGFLIQLLRGIYVDAADDVDVVVLQHAVRIAKYLYPNTYLAGASAILLGPTEDGRLFLSGKCKQRTRSQALEIVQNQAPAHPSVAPGKDDRLQAKDFLALARNIGIKVAMAKEVIEHMAKELMLALREVRLPSMADYGTQGLKRFAQIREIVEIRCREIG
jgi:hypothetical protein